MVAARMAGDAFAGGGTSHALYDAPVAGAAVRDFALNEDEHLDLFLRHLFLPVRWSPSGPVVAHACTDARDLRAIAKLYGTNVRLEPMPKQALVDALQTRFRSRLAHDAALALDETQPALSARRVLTRTQRVIAAALLCAFAIGAILVPAAMQGALLLAAASFYAAHVAFRVLLYALGWSGKGVHRAGDGDLLTAKDDDLPPYSILVPLYREAHMLPQIVHALGRIAYPPRKLDIKLILEECDGATIAAARAMALDDRFEILVVPGGPVRTKPRACNYGLRAARGDYVVIFDAEDRPEPDQLRKAALIFRREPDVACLQARLAFYNARQNWLSRGLMAQTPQGD